MRAKYQLQTETGTGRQLETPATRQAQQDATDTVIDQTQTNWLRAGHARQQEVA